MSKTPATAPAPRLLLIDGSYYLHRAFHSLPPLANQTGFPTGVMHGMVNMLSKLRTEYQPSHVAVVFDAAGGTFRHERYPQYKATRNAMPEVLAMQIVPTQQLIRALGFPVLVVPHVEADDVIGTLAQMARTENLTTVIATSDKDMAQLLVHDDITLVDSLKNAVFGREDIAQRFKVAQLLPEQVIDFLSLAGDASDNVPGIYKVGAKTAAKWLAAYGSADNLVAHANDITGKIGEYLRAGLPDLPLWRELVTIRCDVPLPVTLADLVPQAIDKKALATLCAEYDLFKIQRQYLADASPVAAPPAPVANSAAPVANPAAPVANPAPPARYHLVTDPAALDNLLQKLTAAGVFAFDTETDGLDYMRANLVGMSFALQAGEAFYLPFGHQLSVNLDKKTTLAKLQPLLENPALGKIGQHIKFDGHILRREGITLRGVRDDTMLMSYLLHSTATRHNLDDLAKFYLQRDTIRFSDIAGKGKKQLTFAQIPLAQASEYACEDADVTLQLQQFFAPRLPPAAETLYREVELPVAEILLTMEETGVCLDVAALQAQSAEIAARLAQLEEEAYQLAGERFNLQSPKQLQAILFQKLGLESVRKSPTGQDSTNEEVLEILAEQHSLPALLRQHRELAKLKSTYLDALPAQINPTTGRVHTSYHQAATSTGRLSSSEPNLQNIPIRRPEGQKVRRAFVAPAGWQILAADYSQIELRIMAHLSADSGLIAAFERGQDIHQATAAELFSIPLDEVTRVQRRQAKMINFGLLYGMSASGLARKLALSPSEASAYIAKYFQRYPQVQNFLADVRAQAQRYGYVETIFGRRLYVPEINSDNPQKRQAAERMAINAPMQGSAADIIKKAMIAVNGVLPAEKARLLMQVHDELVFEIAAENVAILRPRLVAAMENAARLRVPLVVSAGVGDNWDEAH